MKNIFKKNQIIITALAIMIAVAGYLNYSGTKLGGEAESPTEAVSATAENEYSDISEEDILSENVSATDEEPESGDDVALEETSDEQSDDDETALIDIDSLDTDDLDGELAGAEDTPGEAVLTSTTTTIGFAAEAKVSREQVRASNKETLLEVINNTNISDDQKQNAIESMVSMTDVAEREASAELLLEAKGFSDVVVSITENSVDVVVNVEEVTDSGRAQIEDIVKRKTGISAENIVITPISVEE